MEWLNAFPAKSEMTNTNYNQKISNTKARHIIRRRTPTYQAYTAKMWGIDASGSDRDEKNK